MWMASGSGAVADLVVNHVFRTLVVYVIAIAMTLTIRELFRRSVPDVWALARAEFDVPADGGDRDRGGGIGLAPVTPLHRRG